MLRVWSAFAEALLFPSDFLDRIFAGKLDGTNAAEFWRKRLER